MTIGTVLELCLEDNLPGHSMPNGGRTMGPVDYEHTIHWECLNGGETASLSMTLQTQ